MKTPSMTGRFAFRSFLVTLGTGETVKIAVLSLRPSYSSPESESLLSVMVFLGGKGEQHREKSKSLFFFLFF